MAYALKGQKPVSTWTQVTEKPRDSGPCLLSRSFDLESVRWVDGSKSVRNTKTAGVDHECFLRACYILDGHTGSRSDRAHHPSTSQPQCIVR